MKRFVVLIAVTVVLSGWGVMDFRPLLQRYYLQEAAGQPQIVWVSETEDSANHFEVHRKLSSEAQFRQVGTSISAKGDGNTYSFIDEQLYKGQAEVIEYRLVAVSSENVEYAFDVLQVNYSPTAVRRTWGSIKAMFQ